VRRELQVDGARAGECAVRIDECERVECPLGLDAREARLGRCLRGKCAAAQRAAVVGNRTAMRRQLGIAGRARPAKARS
jgi:hypothetical protein